VVQLPKTYFPRLRLWRLGAWKHPPASTWRRRRWIMIIQVWTLFHYNN
jgi:hypothetical protein